MHPLPDRQSTQGQGCSLASHCESRCHPSVECAPFILLPKPSIVLSSPDLFCPHYLYILGLLQLLKVGMLHDMHGSAAGMQDNQEWSMCRNITYFCMLGNEVHSLVALYTDQRLSARCTVASAYNFVADFADFFHAAIHTPLYAVLLVMAVIYTSTFFFFGLLWWSILRQVIYPCCHVC